MSNYVYMTPASWSCTGRCIIVHGGSLDWECGKSGINPSTPNYLSLQDIGTLISQNIAFMGTSDVKITFWSRLRPASCLVSAGGSYLTVTFGTSATTIYPTYDWTLYTFSTTFSSQAYVALTFKNTVGTCSGDCSVFVDSVSFNHIFWLMYIQFCKKTEA